MKKRTMYLFLLSLLLIGFCIGFTVKSIFTHVSTDYLKKSSYWESDPVIINCMGNVIKEETIKKGIEFWEKKGESIAFYQYSYQKTACSASRLDGFITLKIDKDLANNRSKILARTKKYVVNGKILSVEIFYKPDTYNYNLLLEHELGHAFGYEHKKILGHIMHPYYDLMGSAFW